MSVSKITIKVVSSDGSEMEINNVIPKAVADNILLHLIEWKDVYSATTTDHEIFTKEKEEFVKQIEK